MQLPIPNAHAAPARSSDEHRRLLTRSIALGMLRVGVAIFIVSTLYIYLVLGDHHVLSFHRLRLTAPICMLLGGLWGLHAWYEALPR